MNPTTTKTTEAAAEAAADPQDDQHPYDDEHAPEAAQGLEDPAAPEAADRDTAAAPGIRAGAAAVVATALGIASLTGTWVGRVAAERETLIGQIGTSQSGSPAQQISEIYGDAWHTTAVVNGLFAVLALITGLVVLLTSPHRPLWVRAVALAGAVLGGLGLLLSAGMYADLFLPLPTTGS
ncbi:hypothetical protein QWM81_18535 [Streptomyces ficellus]|uniref:DUF4064 domain-containing protein n=1 Tax=Streptomyces ficellus TaxID=1977088 RepID=A0ABT7Z930_9ACTN|nr:hypothetical protein [Streptomyces ficellus]MDN3296016.1 hypothetical protein [Streptomyces ficellus]